MRVEQSDVDLLLVLVGHDLRGPLNVISLASDMLERVEGSPSPALIARLRRTTVRLDRLITEIAELVRVRMTDGLSLSRETVDVAELVERVRRRITSTCRQDAACIEIDADPGAVAIDSLRVERAIASIVASRFDEGATPRLRFTAGPGGLEVTISDPGPPVQQRAFEVPERSTVRLFLAGEIARAHGGGATATAANGSVITAVFPEQRSDRPQCDGSARSTSDDVHDRAGDHQDQGDHEDDLRDAGGARRDASEAKDGGDQGEQQEYEGPT